MTTNDVGDARGLGAMPVETLLERLGARTPTPGGGAAAALTAALGAALGQMVVRYSEGKKGLAEHAAIHTEALGVLQELAVRALALADEDVEAYGRLNALWALPENDPERARAMPDAVRGAIAPPRRMLDDALALLRLLDALCGRTSRMLRSDLAIAAVLAEAAARTAAWNVRINLPLLNDADEVTVHQRGLDRDLATAAELARTIEAACG